MVVFNLIRWAERQGRVEGLIQAVHRAKPGNPHVRQLWQDSRAWPTAPTQPAADASPAVIDVFLCYSYEDEAAMRTVREVLRTGGLAVWTDEEMAPGTPDWEEASREAIHRARALVVLLSPGANVSRWVRREISYAQTNNKPIFPLLLEGDLTNAVPMSLFDVQLIDAGKDLHKAALRLLAELAFGPQRTRAQAVYLRMLEGHQEEVTAVAFSPDGRAIASGNVDGAVRLWARATGELLRALEGNGGSVRSVVFSPAGKLLASGSSDGVQLWDTATGELLQTLEEHTWAVTAVAFSPDGGMLASGSRDRTVRLWGMG